MTPRLARIRLYPIKSLDPLEVSEARIHGGAGLAHDREYRFVDAAGKVVNGKRAPGILRIRSSYDLAFGSVELNDGETHISATLPRGIEAVEGWASKSLGLKVKLEQDAERGFPDDEEASGPTVISTATLGTVAEWFDLDVEETRRRFRANLEISGTPPFWEDGLFGPDDAPRPFAIGELALEAINPCARCAVPSLDSRTGQAPDPKFAKTFAELRKRHLPPEAAASRFDHFYRLAVNTRIPAAENGKVLLQGEAVRAVGR